MFSQREYLVTVGRSVNIGFLCPKGKLRTVFHREYNKLIDTGYT